MSSTKNDKIKMIYKYKGIFRYFKLKNIFEPVNWTLKFYRKFCKCCFDGPVPQI